MSITIQVQNNLLFILSDIRSGSTLLAQLLGAHSKMFSVGEMQWLRAYARNDRRLYNPPHDMVCACGGAFAECEFWQSIAARLARPIANTHFSPSVFTWSGPGASRTNIYRRFWQKVLRAYPLLYRSDLVAWLCGGRRIASNNMAVFDEIFRETGARYVVDSSKNMFRFQSIYKANPDRCRIIILDRDYRAVAHSRMKRGVTLQEAAEKWAAKVRQIRTVTRGIPAERITTIKYEDFCGDPVGELTRLCGFVDLSFEERMLLRPSRGIHDLGGSPSKLEAGKREIRLDTSYRGAFSRTQLAQLRQIIGSAAELSGYGE